MKSTLLAPIALTCALAAAASAADVDVFGTVGWSWRTVFDDQFTPANYTNHKMEVGASVKMDEGVRVEAEIAHYSTVKNADGERVRTNIYDGKARTSAFFSDQDSVRLRAIRAMWEFMPGAAIGLGDAHYQIGAPKNAEAWREYNAIMKERGIRGAIFELSGFTGGFGIPFDEEGETKDKSFSVYGQYDIAVLANRKRSLNVKPAMEINFNNSRTRVWNLGLELAYADSWKGLPFTFDMAAGYLDVRHKPVWTMLAEPSFSWGVFSLGGSFYYATLDGSTAEKKQLELDELDLPVQMFLGAEPMFTLHRKFALGFPLIWNNPMVDVDDDEWTTVGIAGHLWPTEGAESETAIRYHKVHRGPDSWEFAWALGFDF